MTKRYSCVRCGGKLQPIFSGAVVRELQHGFNSACPNDQAILKNGGDDVAVVDEPVVMLVTGLTYKRAGTVKFFQCEVDHSHADYFRGEFSERADQRPWKRCIVPGCDGRMQLRSVRLHLDGSIEPFVAYQRRPGGPVLLPPTTMDEEQILRKFLRALPHHFRRVKRSRKSVELFRKGDAPWHDHGTVFTRKMLVIADSETQSVTVALFGCAGWSPEVRRAAQKAKIEYGVIVRGAARSSSKGKAKKK